VIPDLRIATAEDLPAIAVADARAFGQHYSAQDITDFRPLFDPERFLLARDPDGGAAGDGTIVGITGSFPFEVTLPGGAALPVPGVTWVSVAVTHRRRGILRALMREQHRGFAADGVAVSLLTASESAIYGRFGYGTATVNRSVEIARRRAAFRPGTPDPGGARHVETDELRLLAPEIHRRWVASTPGAVSRGDALWDHLLLDREHQRGGGSPLFHLVHPDGYLSYRRLPDRALRVVDLVTVTTEAHAALWRILLAVDLVETITMRALPVDDPLPFLLTDPRQVRTTGLPDGMWARVLDVPAALSARRYAVELDVVLEVHDPFLDLGGRFRLRGGPDGAECTPAGPADGPGVAVETSALGALLFGGQRAGTLARAGLVQAPDPAVLRHLDVAFLADRAPQHGTEF
jgi:predicted acetyltransferase